MTNNAPPPYEDYSDHFSPLQVEVRGSFEESLRRFKSMVQRSKILTLYKERQSFEKPSAKKRRRKREVIERRRLALLREALIASGEWEKRQKSKDEKRKAKRYDRG